MVRTFPLRPLPVHLLENSQDHPTFVRTLELEVGGGLVRASAVLGVGLIRRLEEDHHIPHARVNVTVWQTYPENSAMMPPPPPYTWDQHSRQTWAVHSQG